MRADTIYLQNTGSQLIFSQMLFSTNLFFNVWPNTLEVFWLNLNVFVREKWRKFDKNKKQNLNTAPWIQRYSRIIVSMQHKRLFWFPKKSFLKVPTKLVFHSFFIAFREKPNIKSNPDFFLYCTLSHIKKNQEVDGNC